MPPIIQTRRLDLVLLRRSVLEALLEGRADAAGAGGGFRVPAEWPDQRDRAFLGLRLRQIRDGPATEPWLARALVLRDDPARPMVGHIGFHGPPRDGALELGYTVFEDYRQRGYATEAAGGMMDWARGTHDIKRFIVSISPANTPSLAMARKLGFRRIGEHFDEEDGLESVLQLVRP